MTGSGAPAKTAPFLTGTNSADNASVLPHVLRNSTDRFRSGEIADQRHDQVVFLESLDQSELIVSCEKIPVSRYTIALGHQFGVARPSPEVAIATNERVPQFRAGLEKRFCNVANPSLILVRELEAFLLFQILDDAYEICLEKGRIGMAQSVGPK